MSLILRILVAIVIAPWVVCVAVVKAFVSLIRWPAEIAAREADFLRCPAGHPNPVFGRWTCGCGAVYVGHAFGPCPICGMPAGWVRCDACGLALRSPWKNE